MVTIKLPDPEPAPPKAFEPLATAAEPAMVSVSTFALLIAIALTLPAVIGVSITVALMVCVRSLTATEAPTEPAVVPSLFEIATPAPPESVVMSESSRAVSVRSPLLLTTLPASICANNSVSTILTETLPAPANTMLLELLLLLLPVLAEPATAIVTVSSSVAPVAERRTPPSLAFRVLLPRARAQTKLSTSFTETEPVTPASAPDVIVRPPIMLRIRVSSAPRSVMPCPTSAPVLSTSIPIPNVAFVSPLTTATPTEAAMPTLVPPPLWAPLSLPLLS